MKKFFALCSMIVALGFVSGCNTATTPATSTDASEATADNGEVTTPAEEDSLGSSDEEE